MTPPPRTAPAAGSLVFLRNLLNSNPQDWDMLLYNGIRVDGVSEGMGLGCRGV